MAMAPSSSVMSVVCVLLFLFPVLLTATDEPTSLLSEQMVLAACKTAVGGGRESLDYQLFVGFAVGLLVKNATSTNGKIDRLLRGGRGVKDDVAVARCLQSCKSLYGGILEGGPACTAAVKAKKFGEATAILEKAAAAAKECEDGFRNNKAASPLWAENDDAIKLANLAVALVKNI